MGEEQAGPEFDTVLHRKWGSPTELALTSRRHLVMQSLEWLSERGRSSRLVFRARQLSTSEGRTGFARWITQTGLARRTARTAAAPLQSVGDEVVFLRRRPSCSQNPAVWLFYRRLLAQCRLVVVDQRSEAETSAGERVYLAQRGVRLVDGNGRVVPTSAAADAPGCPNEESSAHTTIDLTDRVALERWSIDAARRLDRRRSLSADQISVVLATRRPDDLGVALRMIASQTARPREVLVGLHGAIWEGVPEPTVSDGLDVSFQRVGDDVSFGRVLTRLSQDASGDFVVKWDDDDWYGTEHLDDLLISADRSGAHLVGKAAEFVRLETCDVTVRRFSDGAESFSRTLAGGTMMIDRTALEHVGWWGDAHRHVDLDLIGSVIARGGLIYRGHGFGYLLRRRASGHTWNATDAYFLAQSQAQRPGLDLTFAGCDLG